MSDVEILGIYQIGIQLEVGWSSKSVHMKVHLSGMLPLQSFERVQKGFILLRVLTADDFFNLHFLN